MQPERPLKRGRPDDRAAYGCRTGAATVTPFRYALVVGLGFGLLLGNYVAWGLYELGYPSPTVVGAIVATVVGFPTFVLLQRMTR